MQTGAARAMRLRRKDPPRLTQPIVGLEAQIFALYIHNNPTQGNQARLGLRHGLTSPVS